MRCGLARAVSSALLLVMVLAMPHHDVLPRSIHEASASADPCAFLLSEFYPRGTCGDEYVVISSCCDGWLDLNGWSFTDGEGHIKFIKAMPVAPHGSCTVSWNSTSYRDAFGEPPTIAVDDVESRALLAMNGTFRLGDSGDSIALLSPQYVAADFVVYGSSNATSPIWNGEPIDGIRRGEVVRRMRNEAGMIDSNSAIDWMHFREYRYGYTEYSPMSFMTDSGDITAFSSPDSSLEVLLDAIRGATRSISICTYEFSSVAVEDELIRACSRGVSVRLLVDGSPVGDMDEKEIACLSALASNGADVRTVRGNSSKGVIQHVGEVHAKYIVVDHIFTIVMSENLVEQGVPADKVFGNRGWGVKVRSEELARRVELLFEDDSRITRPDIVRWTDDYRFNRSASPVAYPKAAHTVGLAKSLVSRGGAMVTVFVSPDCSPTRPYICSQLELARSLEIEQFQADLNWKGRWSEDECLNPLLQDILDMLDRGGSVRLLLDSSWFNLGRNSEVSESMFENATLEGKDGEFALIDADSPIFSLHNKGVIADGRYVLISSNNWVYASFAQNREMGLVIDSPEIAAYFSAIFAIDWVPDTTPPIADAGPDRTMAVGETAIISSNGSQDDRVIASFSWDTDGDGSAESHNLSIEFAGEFPGTFNVILTVEDSWGNKASDEVTIVVVARDGPGQGRWQSPVRSLGWTVPLVFGGAILFVRWSLLRRSSRSPRKLNHRRRS